MRFESVRTGQSPRSRRKRMAWSCVAAGILFIAMAPAVSDGVQQNQIPRLPPELNRVPDSNQANQINDQQAKKDSFEAANTERKKQISADSAKLLKLAAELKSEVDKTNKDTLSVGVIRKADEIEKLAHSIKEKMQLTVGAS
jgi:hypothetical protein